MEICVNQFNTHTGINLLPLAAGLVIAHAKADSEVGSKHRFCLRIRREDPESTAASFDDTKVIGYSCYMWNVRHSLEVARHAKRLFPQALNVFGGPSVPRNSDRIHEFMRANPQVDALVIGEGEITFTEIIRQTQADGDLSRVDGCVYRSGSGEAVINRPRSRGRSLGDFPSPFLDGTFDELLAADGDLITGALWETNRGCPFGCTFCDWGQATQSKINEFPLERLHKELEWMSLNKFQFCWAADANFGIRKRDMDVAREVAAFCRSTGYPSFFQVSWVKNCNKHVKEIYETLAAAGIRAPIALSMQSFDPATLIAVNRKNIKHDAFVELKEHFGSSGVETYTEVLLGLPGETYDSFSRGLAGALSPYYTDFIAVYLCRLLENTELDTDESRRRHGLQTRICILNIPRRTVNHRTIPEFEEIVVGTNSMPIPDWKRAFEFTYILLALYNQRLAYFMMNFLRCVAGLDLKTLIEFLLNHAGENQPTLLEMINRVKFHEQSILDCGSVVHPLRGFGTWDWDPHEACYLIGAAKPDRLLDDIWTLSKMCLEEQGIAVNHAMFEECFRFQRALVPRFERQESFSETFMWDWEEFYQTWHADSLRAKANFPVHIQFIPPRFTETSQEEYLREQIRVTRSGTRTLCEVRRLSSPTITEHVSSQPIQAP